MFFAIITTVRCSDFFVRTFPTHQNGEPFYLPKANIYSIIHMLYKIIHLKISELFLVKHSMDWILVPLWLPWQGQRKDSVELIWLVDTKYKIPGYKTTPDFVGCEIFICSLYVRWFAIAFLTETVLKPWLNSMPSDLLTNHQVVNQTLPCINYEVVFSVTNASAAWLKL